MNKSNTQWSPGREFTPPIALWLTGEVAAVVGAPLWIVNPPDPTAIHIGGAVWFPIAGAVAGVLAVTAAYAALARHELWVRLVTSMSIWVAVGALFHPVRLFLLQSDVARAGFVERWHVEVAHTLNFAIIAYWATFLTLTVLRAAFNWRIENSPSEIERPSSRNKELIQLAVAMAISISVLAIVSQMDIGSFDSYLVSRGWGNTLIAVAVVVLFSASVLPVTLAVAMRPGGWLRCLLMIGGFAWLLLNLTWTPLFYIAPRDRSFGHFAFGLAITIASYLAVSSGVLLAGRWRGYRLLWGRSDNAEESNTNASQRKAGIV